MNAIIIDEKTGRELGRPWIALGMDVLTRMATGFHLTLAPPTRHSTSLCLVHSICDKTRWLAERRIPLDWPVAGLPDALRLDADSFYGRRAFVKACKTVGVETVWSEPDGARYGAHIERLVGDRLGRVSLATDAGPVGRREPDDCRSANLPRLTLRALESRIGAEIAGTYHRRRHADLGRAPLAVWRAHAQGRSFRTPMDCVSFRLSLLPEEECALDADGLRLFDRLYRSRAIADDIDAGRARLTVRYDPRDLSRIFVQRRSGRFVKAAAVAPPLAEAEDDILLAASAPSGLSGLREEEGLLALLTTPDEDEDWRDDAPDTGAAPPEAAALCADKCARSCPFQFAGR